MINRTLWEQWELVNYIANKDFEGNVITPERFNQLIKIVNLDLFKIKMGLPEEYQPGNPIPRQTIDLNSRLTSETKFLKVFDPNYELIIPTVVFNGDDAFYDQYYVTQIILFDGLRYEVIQNPAGIEGLGDPPNEPIYYRLYNSYPTGLFDIEDIRYIYQRNIDGSPVSIPKPVERLTEGEYSDRAGNYTKQPTTKNPVCVFRSDGIYVYPDTIDSVELSYVRYPVDPVFDYTQEAGYITDGGASVEYEWGDHLFMDLTRMILGYIGINLREEQLQQYAETHKQQGV